MNSAKIVCIAGMHRSGTSMVAHLLNKCGLYLGHEHEIMASGSANPDGHWENWNFVRLNEDLLSMVNAAWDLPPKINQDWTKIPAYSQFYNRATKIVDSFNDKVLWGWKDPRNTLTLDFWLSVLPNLKILVCLRDPLEVAQSLEARGSASLDFSLNLWHSYNQRLLGWVESQHAINADHILVTHYQSYFEDPYKEILRVTRFLDISVDEKKLNEVALFVNPQLRHLNTDVKQFTLPASVYWCYAKLCSYTPIECRYDLKKINVMSDATSNNEAIHSIITRQAMQMEKYASQINDLTAVLTTTTGAFDEKNKHIALLQRQLEEMTNDRDRCLHFLQERDGHLIEKNNHIDLLQRFLSEITRDRDQAVQIIKDRDVELQNRSQNIKQLLDDATKNQAVIDSLRQQLTEQDQLLAQIKTLQSENQILLAQQNKLQAELELKRVKNQELTCVLEKQQVFIGALKLQLEIDNEAYVDAFSKTQSKLILEQQRYSESQSHLHETQKLLGQKQNLIVALNDTSVVRLGRKYWKLTHYLANRRFSGDHLLNRSINQGLLLVDHFEQIETQNAEPIALNLPTSNNSEIDINLQEDIAFILQLLEINLSTANLLNLLRRYLNEHQINEIIEIIHKICINGVSREVEAVAETYPIKAINLPPFAQRGHRLKILFITGEFPNYRHGGGGRAADLITKLSQHNDIYLFARYVANEDVDALQYMQTVCKNIIVLAPDEFDNGDITQLNLWPQQYQFDVVHYVWPAALRYFNDQNAKKHVFTYVESVSLSAKIDLSRFELGTFEWIKAFCNLIQMLKLEVLMTNGMDARIVVTPSDGQFVSRFVPQKNFFVVPTPINFDEFELDDVAPHPRTIAFVGNFLHIPNEDAVHFWMRNVFPIVKNAIPNLQVFFVGAKPSDNVKKYNDNKNIFVTDTVEDVRPYIQRSLFCIAPLISGAGIRGKVNQYAALRRACVSTSIGAKDLPYQDGTAIFIADDAVAFAEYVIQLLQNPDKALHMGQLAYEIARKTYDVSTAIDGMNRLHQYLSLYEARN